MNGDPLTDVANFTMMFLQPEKVDYRFAQLAGHELLLSTYIINMSCEDLAPCWYILAACSNTNRQLNACHL